MNLKTKLATAALASLVIGAAATARANPSATQTAAAAARADIGKTLGFVPQFFLKFPEGMLPGAWDEMKTLQTEPEHRAAGTHQGADRPRGRGADPVPLLHRRPHRVRAAERRQRRRRSARRWAWRPSPATGARS